MRRLGVQGLIFFQLGEPPILHDAIVDCRIPFFQSRLLRGHTLLASPPELDIFFRTRCLVPSCECGSRFCRRWQVPNLLCRLHLVSVVLAFRRYPVSLPEFGPSSTLRLMPIRHRFGTASARGLALPRRFDNHLRATSAPNDDVDISPLGDNELERTQSLTDLSTGARPRDKIITRSMARNATDPNDPPPTYSEANPSVQQFRELEKLQRRVDRQHSNAESQQRLNEQRNTMMEARLDEITSMMRDLTATMNQARQQSANAQAGTIRQQPMFTFASLATQQPTFATMSQATTSSANLYNNTTHPTHTQASTASANAAYLFPTQQLTAAQPARMSLLQPAKLIMPISGACCDKPMRFLPDMMDYVQAVGISEQHFKHVIKQALKGPAAEWYDHAEDQIRTIAQFQQRFKNRFWSRIHQQQKRETLEFGYYDADKNQSRSEYVISIYNQIKALDEPPAEIDMIDKFSRHFDDHTQNAIVAQRLTRVEDLIEFLDRVDNMGKLNADRSAVRPRKEPYWARQPKNYTKILPRPNVFNNRTMDRPRTFTPHKPKDIRQVDVLEVKENEPEECLIEIDEESEN
ncbi:unnamed protein product [Trichogramma brassicae]|uniref:Retrotransposon gag domain-containing protein n=1 Tax=Trichogramma brassicae TaxID=86971 RepID=A0A6H5ISL9_9HYME|nr:unnamed protein product [Trichogramma brassicae]